MHWHALFSRAKTNATVIVLITDGPSFDGLESPRDDFHEIDGLLFVVGVGDASQAQIEPVADEDPNNPGSKLLWYSPGDWSALDFSAEVSEKICSL